MTRSARKQSDPDLGVLAAQVLFALQKELFQRLAGEGHPNLRPRHGAVLAYLDAEGSRATDLSYLSGQHKQVIGTLVDELEALGYVERQPDPQDRRAKLIRPAARRVGPVGPHPGVLPPRQARPPTPVGRPRPHA